MKRFLLFVAVALAAMAGALAAAAGGPDRLPEFVAAADPLWVLAVAAAALALCSFAAGWLSGDYSWVDRLWSTAPIAFAWYYAARSAWAWPALAAAVLVAAWGVRLTYNFARKGGYSGEEDYRWGVLRGRIRHPLAWQAFNLGFISCFQIGLFLLFTLPLRLLWEQAAAGRPVAALPFALAGLAMLASIVWEGLADSQQWRFHGAKAAAKRGEPVPARYAADVERGFLGSGLFAYSRHPNYFGELMVWWTLYLAAAGAVGQWINYSLVGPVVLTALFVGSTVFTEEITGGKYPAYRGYQRRVSPIVPLPPRRGAD